MVQVPEPAGVKAMNAMTDSILKSLVCGAAALLITMVVSLSFLQSTAVPPGVRGNTTAAVAKLSGRQPHALFGQSQPAVLVD